MNQDIRITIRRPSFWILFILISFSLCIYYKWMDWFDWYWAVFIIEYRYDIIGISLLPPFIYAAIAFKWRISLMLWVLALVILIPIIVSYNQYSPSDTFMNIAFMLSPILITIMLALNIGWRDRQREIMGERDRERQMYINQIFAAQENERQRIAQELHDDAIQTLVALASNMSTIVSRAIRKNEPIHNKDVENIRKVVVHMIEELRRLCIDLRPAIMDDMGLESSLNWLVNKFQNDHSIKTSLVVNGEPRLLKPEEDVIVFRIVQEALNNVWKHAKATEVSVRLDFLPSQLNISVQDNGIGFIMPKSISTFSTKGKVGIVGMRQRVRSLGGVFKIRPETGKGTMISVALSV